MQQVVGVMFTETTVGRILGFETNFDFWHVYWHKTENENACPETKLKPILWLILKTYTLVFICSIHLVSL